MTKDTRSTIFKEKLSMKLNHTPPYCSCPCHRGAQMFEYLECCPHIGEQWAEEWDAKYSREIKHD